MTIGIDIKVVPYSVKHWLGGKISLPMYLDKKTLANGVSVPLHFIIFNTLTMFGQETWVD